MYNQDIHYSRYHKEQLAKAKHERYEAIAVISAGLLVLAIMWFAPELRAIASSF